MLLKPRDPFICDMDASVCIFKVNIIIRYIIVLVTQKEIYFDVLNEDL
jgi:hypothetical protein